MSQEKHARANAAEKVAVRDHVNQQPSVPTSNQAVSQGRFPGETPLTGEDRPLTEAGRKRHGFDGDGDAARASTGPVADGVDHGGVNKEFGTEVGE